MPKRIRVEERYLLAPGEVLPGKEAYTIQNYVGQGAFGAAYRATNPKGEVCFIKEFFPASRPSQVPELTRIYATERDVVRRIGNYELIPRFWEAFQHEGYSYLITDYIQGPDLETVLKGPNKPETDVLVRWCVCLCHEVSYLHSRNVVHHDLKPTNIRLNQDGDPVVVDFGAAHWYRDPTETTEHLYGSDSFLAPEYADRSVEDLDAGRRMDVFAMGRILVELMVGQRLTQEEIDGRQDQLYGQILHSGKLDISFVRAVFRAVSYDPERRFSSGVEMEEDITPAAPPVLRARPSVIDFGFAEDANPREMVIQAYNVGGGTLHADLAVEGDWVEIGTSGAITGKHAMFERNRQSVRVIAYPERVQAGINAAGRIVFNYQTGRLEVPVQIRRAVEVSDVSVHPGSLRLNAPPGGFGSARATFTNHGAAPAHVHVSAPVDIILGIQPDDFVVQPGGKVDVTVSIDSTVLGERDIESELRWLVEGNPRPAIPIKLGVRRGSGLLTALTDKLRKK